MRSIISCACSFAVLLVQVASGAGTNVPYADKIAPYVKNIVTVTNGLPNPLKLGFFAPRGAALDAKEKIWIVGSVEREGGLALYLPKDKYLCTLTLYDKAGSSLNKTQLGQKYGLANISGWDRALVIQNRRGEPRPFGVAKGKVKFMTAEGTWEGYREWKPVIELEPPAELFEIPSAGEYRLILQLQVFVKIGPEKRLVRIPPMHIAVISK